jgi:hypothetical protein
VNNNLIIRIYFINNDDYLKIFQIYYTLLDYRKISIWETEIWDNSIQDIGIWENVGFGFGKKDSGNCTVTIKFIFDAHMVHFQQYEYMHEDQRSNYKLNAQLFSCNVI